MLSDDELLRYSRHILLPDFDIDGQEKLCESEVLVLGLGGLGSPVAQYLAAAGVGKLVLVDDDFVEVSNLQRQVIHNHQALGLMKAESAKQGILNINPSVEVECITNRLSLEELNQILPSVDLMIDGTDNLESRRIHNKAAISQKVPLVTGAAIGWEGQLTTVLTTPDSHCYECLYGHIGTIDLNCSENGIMSPVVGIIGTSMALESIKVLSGVGTNLGGRLQLFDGKSGSWTELRISKNPNCDVCGK